VKKRKIELLSPARDLECGFAAIDHGADAVYIGGPKFGARAAAGNSMVDLARLADYAHSYDARVYLTLNTILFDHEIEDAVRLTWDAYHAGVDALIIQDMGLLECDLPPLPLHASTQTNNQKQEKVIFLEKVGFKQIVLARELNLSQIREIYNQTSVTLEFFIHGALCVCYSGQCYMSHFATGRSGNRGDCTQMCRHQYTLTDSLGKIIEKDKYLLSLRDLNLTQNLEQLIDAGISSFKIEGRLKGPEYVKNITSHYRKEFDKILSKREDLEASSAGKSSPGFEPDPEKSFNRFFTQYKLTPYNNTLVNLNTPKSIGQKIGKVIVSNNDFLKIETSLPIANGDGLCFFDNHSELKGFRVNKIEGNIIYPLPKLKIELNTILYRNKDSEFENQLEKSHSCRKIRVQMVLKETENGIVLQIQDEQDNIVNSEIQLDKVYAKDSEQQVEVLKHHLTKFGNTIFAAESVSIQFKDSLFIPGKIINELRRKALDGLIKKRLALYTRTVSKIEPNNFPFPYKNISYSENIANSMSEQFYRRHGISIIEKAFELKEKKHGQLLMSTKYCIRQELGICWIDDPEIISQKNTSLFIEDKTGRYKLEFECNKCEMRIYST
jgi:23S rRNA 5-hydroxycytidine C2501 synthase